MELFEAELEQDELDPRPIAPPLTASRGLDLLLGLGSVAVAVVLATEYFPVSLVACVAWFVVVGIRLMYLALRIV